MKERCVQAKKRVAIIKKNYRIAVNPPKATLPMPKAAKKGSYPPIDMIINPVTIKKSENIAPPTFCLSIVTTLFDNPVTICPQEEVPR